jgi:hypothetical protein
MLLTRAHLLSAALALLVLALAAGAAAKDFRPGDLRVCNATRCVAIRRSAALAAFSSFYYHPGHPSRTARPPLRAPYFELRFPNGYVTGIVATRRFNRFLSYGVNEDRFAGGTWYRVPARAASAIRATRRLLDPMPLTHAAISRSQ